MHMPRRTRKNLLKRKRRRVFIREWRKHRDLTLEQLAERVGITHASLSRIERGLQDYNQTLLEALATELRTDPASLIMRNPSDDTAIWTLWDQAQEGEKRQIEEMAKIITKAS